MARFVALALFLGLVAAFASGRLERGLIYPFDPTRTAPPAGLTETDLGTGDGEVLVVWSAPPAPGRPTLLYFNGNAGSLADRSTRFAAFTKRGFGLVAAGYRGSSGSSGTASEPALIADAQALAQALPELAGPGPVIYYGESLGAAVAIALAQTDPPAALVLEAPFASIAAMADAVYGTPSAALLARSKWPNTTRIATVTAPIFILHGENDAVVPPSQGRAVFEAAGSADARFDLVAGAGHVDVWQPGAQRRLYAFLDRF